MAASRSWISLNTTWMRSSLRGASPYLISPNFTYDSMICRMLSKIWQFPSSSFSISSVTVGMLSYCCSRNASRQLPSVPRN